MCRSTSGIARTISMSISVGDWVTYEGPPSMRVEALSGDGQEAICVWYEDAVHHCERFPVALLVKVGPPRQATADNRYDVFNP
jgi:hypothetical protein